MLKLKNIKKTFCKGTICTAQDLSLEVAKGEIFTILGKSGSGKSTLLRMIVGFDIPEEGEIEIDGKVVFSQSKNIEPKNRPVSMVFQSYALFPHMSVEKNILFGYEKEGKKNLDALLKKAGIEQIKKRYPHEISGGQQQRVALVRAMIRAPKLLLLDEPLSNIDIDMRMQLRKELKEMIKSFGITALFVTHDREDAFYMSDRIGVIDSGRMLQVGTPKELYLSPKEERVAKFFGKINVLIWDSKKICIRPENFYIDKNGVIEAEVREIVYHGAYNEIFFKSQYGELVAHMVEELRVGEGLRLGFMKHSFLDE